MDKDMDKILHSLRDAAEEIQRENDNLLRAIAMIAAKGQIQIVPTSTLFGREAKPVICLPERMYDRMFELFPSEQKAGR